MRPGGGYDAAVVGLGVTGAAITWFLARRGARTLALDRHRPPHSQGSSHGRTRIIRKAYFESPDYGPLLERAYAGWGAVEREAGVRLFHRTGALTVGRDGGELIERVRRSSREAGVPIRALDPGDLSSLYPALRLEKGWTGILDSEAGVLRAEESVEAFLALAGREGAHLRYEEGMSRWEETGGEVRIETPRGRYSARSVVLSPGPWLPSLAGPKLHLPLQVTREVAAWFRPVHRTMDLGPGRLPVVLQERLREGVGYIVPDFGEGIRVGFHHDGEPTDPDRTAREVKAREVEALRAFLNRAVPDAGGRLVDHSVCLYTSTPDHHFAVGPHPRASRITVVSACSGHGFKFAPALGELVADRVIEGAEPSELAPFAVDRFGPG